MWYEKYDEKKKDKGIRTSNSEIAINQVSATSKIHVSEDAAFTAVTKGIGTSISYEKCGRQAERFDTPDAENIIELNGIKERACHLHGQGKELMGRNQII